MKTGRPKVALTLMPDELTQLRTLIARGRCLPPWMGNRDRH